MATRHAGRHNPGSPGTSRAAGAQAYEGLETAKGLREEYILLPARVKEVYLAHLLEGLAEHGVRSAIIFAATCRGCHLLSLLLQELGVAAAALHSHQPQRRRLAALDRCASRAQQHRLGEPLDVFSPSPVFLFLCRGAGCCEAVFQHR